MQDLRPLAAEQLDATRTYLQLGVCLSKPFHRVCPIKPAPIEPALQAWGVDSSAKLSPFLALGCLSPRMVYWEVLRLAAAEQEAAEGLTATPHAAAAAAAGATGAGTAGTGAAAGAAAVGAAAARAAAEPHVWREPQKGDTWEWLLMHLGIRDFFIFSAMQNEAGGFACVACAAVLRRMVGLLCCTALLPSAVC